MEDASLDDFFAKKDKSKKKSKVKSVEGEDGVKSTKKDKKKDKNKINSTNSSSNKSQEKNQPDDDEWNDFEEEKAVDYSGLRVQNLQKKGDQDNDAEGEEEEFDENGDVKERKDGTSGPWNKNNPVATPVAPVVEKPAPAAAPVVSSGKYIPPSQRAGAASSATSVPSSRRKKELPNIRSELDFPTLAFGQEEKQSQHDNPNQSKGGNLTLENKFSVLQD